jgi:hypothetical protein
MAQRERKAKPLSGNSFLKKTITELESLVLQRRQLLQRLAEEQDAVRARADAVKRVDAQVRGRGRGRARGAAGGRRAGCVGRRASCLFA